MTPERVLAGGVRIVGVRAERGVAVATVRDAEGRELDVEWWRGRPERPSYRDGELLRFAYRGSLPATADLDRLDRVVEALLAEEQWLASLPVVAEPARVDAVRMLFLTETVLAARVSLALPRAGSTARAVQSVLEREAAAGPRIGCVALYFDTRCRQACEFCAEPLTRDRPLHRVVSRALAIQNRLGLDLVSQGAVEATLEWIAGRPEPIAFLVTGHDWLGHPHRERLLQALERNPGVPLRIQGPSLGLDDPALVRRVAALPGLRDVETTLQSHDAAEHDAMVGRPGAHRRLVAALTALREAGVHVEVSVVLTRRALRTLPATLTWLSAHGHSVRIAGFVPDRKERAAARPLAPLDEIRAALAAVPPGIHAAVAGIVDVPVCVVPDALLPRLQPGVDAETHEQTTFGSGCPGCADRARCSGVARSYSATFGERGFEPR